MREFTIRLHEDEVKLLPMCLTDDGTYEGVLTNGIIAQIIRASKKNVDEHNPVYSYVYEDDQ
mgnify:FL=1